MRATHLQWVGGHGSPSFLFEFFFSLSFPIINVNVSWCLWQPNGLYFYWNIVFFLGGGGGEGRGTLKKFIRHELLVLCLLSWMEAYRPPAKERRVNFFCLSFWEVFKLQWYAFNRSVLVNLKKRVGNKLLNFDDRTNSRQQNMWDCCCL